MQMYFLQLWFGKQYTRFYITNLRVSMSVFDGKFPGLVGICNGVIIKVKYESVMSHYLKTDQQGKIPFITSKVNSTNRSFVTLSLVAYFPLLANILVPKLKLVYDCLIIFFCLRCSQSAHIVVFPPRFLYPLYPNSNLRTI